MRVIMDSNMNVAVYLSQSQPINLASAEVISDDMTMGGEYMEGGMEGGMEGTTVKDPLLSSWPVVIGISCGAIILGLAIGILLGRKKIKKGIELYEDN